MVDRNELEALLIASPVDDEVYRVYGDWLLARGESRGELIAIDDAARRALPHERVAWRHRRNDLLARHPELEPPASSNVTLDWQLGFVRAVRIRGPQPPDVLAALFAHASLAFVSTVVLSSWRIFTQDELDELVACAPRTLRALDLGERGHAHATVDNGLDLDALFEARPALEELYAQPRVRFARAPHLRSLELVDGSPETLALVVAAELPALESLVVHFAPNPLFGASLPRPTRAVELRPLLAARLPRLATLALQDVPFGDDLIAELVASPLLRQLRVLRLWNAGLTRAGIREITKASFGHLEVLDLRDPGLDEASERAVADVAREVLAIPSQLRALVRP